MKFSLIVIGDEILSGRRPDRHLNAVIGLLADRGMALSSAVYLADDPNDIAATLSKFFASGDAVFSCGGIGATADDHTRPAAAAALGRPLVLHHEAYGFVRERIRVLAAEQGSEPDFDSPPNRHRRELACFPAGASVIPNPVNGIAGFSVGQMHFVPGFPEMAHPMIAWVLDRLYAGEHGRSRLHEWTVVVLGRGESDLAPLMREAERRFAPVRTFSLPHLGDAPDEGCIEFGAKGTDGHQVASAGEYLRSELARIGARLRNN